MHQIFIDHVERDHVTDLYMIDPTDSGQPAPVVNMVAIHQLLEIPLFRPNLFAMSWTKAPTILPRA